MESILEKLEKTDAVKVGSCTNQSHSCGGGR